MNKAGFAAGLLALGITAISAVPALAVTFDSRPKILVHVKATAKNPCTAGSAGVTDCSSSQITPSGALIPLGGPGYVYIYLLTAKGGLMNITGLQCGISYQDGGSNDNVDLNKIDVFGWFLCATLQFITQEPGHTWPQAGGGNLITWNSETVCQSGDVAVAGYFYAAAYANAMNDPDVFSVIPRPVDGVAKVATCANVESNLIPSDLGWATFSTGGATPGCNPCAQICPPVAVETTTWGGIKSLFK